jgi:hypothetical protein
MTQKVRKHGDQRMDEETKSTYRELLQSYRIDESKDPIANRRPWHCKIAVEELVEFGISKAREARKNQLPERPRIRLLTSVCPNHIYGSHGFLERLEEFFDAGGTVQVLVYSDSFDTRGSALFAITKEQAGIQFRCSRTSFKSEQLKHFMTVGDQAYRVEASHPPHKSSDFTDLSPEIPARICFNDPEGTSNLKGFFDALWDACGDSAESIPAAVAS